MRILVDIVSAAFAILSLIAAVSQRKTKETPHVIMASGAAVLLAAVVINVLNYGFDWIIGLIGAGIICAAAIWNGKRSGNFHIQHHVIRIVLSILIVAGFVFL